MCCTGTPSFSLRAELGRYPMLVTAAKLVSGYWNQLVRRDGERLAKQAFLRNLELSGQHLRHMQEKAATQRRRHPELFSTDDDDMRKFFEQSPISVAAFVSECYKACCSHC